MRGLIPLLLLLLPSVPLHGEEIDLPPVEVTWSRPPFLDSYTSVTVIEPAEEETAGRTVADFLATVPGVQILRSGSAGQRQTVTIRGGNSRQVVVLLEGFSTNDPQGSTTDLSQIPLEAVEAVEVYRGAKGAIAGNGATGGAVVIRLKKGRKPRFLTRFAAGAWWPASPDSIQGSIVAGHKGLFLAYSARRADGSHSFTDTNGADRTRDNNASKSETLTVSWTGRHTGKTKLEVFGNMAIADRGAPGLEQFPSDQGEEQSNSFLVGSRLAARKVGGRPLSVVGTLSWGLWQWHFRDPKTYLGPEVDSASGNHRVQASADARFAPITWLDIAAGFQGTSESVKVTKRGGDDTESSRLLFDPVASVRVGKRGQPVRAAGNVRLALSDSHETVAVPSVEAAWLPLASLTVAASAGRAYRLPAFDELFFESSGIRGNPDLAPEDAWGLDLAVKFALAPVRAELTFFYQKMLESILFMQVSPYLIEARNTGPATAKGIEFSVAAGMGGFALAASLAWLEAVLDDGGKRLPNKSRYTGSLEGRFTRGPVSFHTTALVSSAFFLDRFESREEEGRLMIDAGLSADLGQGFRAGLDVRNLLNKQDAVDSFQHPLPGLGYYLTLEHSIGREEEQ